MLYPVVVHKEEGGVWLSFPDVPEAFTHGADEADALSHGLDALETALDFYFDAGTLVPLPSKARRGQRTLEVPMSVAAVILLHNEMLAQKVRPVELAKRLGIAKQEMTRILSLRHATKIDTIAGALASMGKRLELQVL